MSIESESSTPTPLFPLSAAREIPRTTQPLESTSTDTFVRVPRLPLRYFAEKPIPFVCFLPRYRRRQGKRPFGGIGDIFNHCFSLSRESEVRISNSATCRSLRYIPFFQPASHGKIQAPQMSLIGGLKEGYETKIQSTYWSRFVFM